MARTLPWKKKNDAAVAAALAATKPPAAAPQPPSSPKGRANLTGAPSATRTVPRSTPTSTKPSAKSRSRRAARFPSTSPPPEPVAESFMVMGLDHDDQWRMVEDEFLSVAGTFTAHLHAAEYQRLKALTKSQNADTIRNISRPVTGVPTGAVKRRLDILAKSSKQHAGLKRSLSRMKAEDRIDDDGDDASKDVIPWAGTSLQGLMDSPSKKLIPITSVLSAQAAAQDTPSKRKAAVSAVGSGRFHTGRVVSSATTPAGLDDHNDTNRPQRSRSRDTTDPAPALSHRPFKRRQISPPRSFARKDGPSLPSRVTSAPARQSSPVRTARYTSSLTSAQQDSDDSDGPIESDFQRRMREKNSQRKMPRHRSFTNDDSEKEEPKEEPKKIEPNVEPRKESKRCDAYIIPSF